MYHPKDHGQYALEPNSLLPGEHLQAHNEGQTLELDVMLYSASAKAPELVALGRLWDYVDCS